MNSPRAGVLSLLALVAIAAVGLFLWQPWRESAGGAVGVGVGDGANAQAQTPAPAAAARGAATPESRSAAPEVAAAPAAVGATAADAVRYTLAGRVVDDAGQPVVGVEVAASLPDRLGNGTRRPASEAKVGRSGSDGRFQIADLAPGLVNVVLKSEAWAAEKLPLTFELQGRKGPDSVEITVVKAAQVSGFVTEVGGGPVAGATVRAERTRAGGLAQGFPVDLLGGGDDTLPRTGSKGEFALKGLYPGSYVLRVRKAGFMAAEQTLELQRGENRSDLAIGLQQGLSFHGRVVDDLGRPVAGAEVFPRRRRTMGQSDLTMVVESPERQAGTRTDASGSFELAGMGTEPVDLVATHEAHQRAEVTQVKPGGSEIVLRVVRNGAIEGRLVDGAGNAVADAQLNVDTAEGPALIRAGGASATYDKATGNYRVANVRPGKATVVAEIQGRNPVQSAPVEVPPGETVNGVDLVLRSGATLLAHVADPAGQPLANALVEVLGKGDDDAVQIDHGGNRRSMRVRRGSRGATLPVPGMEGSRVVASGRTTADGTVKLTGLEAGDVQVVARHKDFAPSALAPVTLVAEGAAESALRVRSGGSIEGSCVGADGALLPGEDVIVHGPTEGDAASDHELSSAQDGSFRTDKLAPGSYEVRFKELGPRGGAVNDGPQIMIAGLAPKRQPFTVDATVAEGQVSRITLRKPALVTFSGTVRDGEGLVAGAELTLRGADELDIDLPMGNTTRQQKTRKNGAFTFADLVPGDYILRWRRNPSALSAELKLTLAENAGTVTRDLQIPGGTVTGRVLSADNKPVAGARVTLEAGATPGQPQRREQRVMITMSMDSNGDAATATATGGRRAMARTGDDGTFVFHDVPEGRYDLKTEHDKFADGKKSGVDVAGNAAIAAGDINVGPGGVIDGEIVDATGKPVRMSMVFLRADGEEPPGSKNTFARGNKFSFTGLKAGKYTVSGNPIGDGDQRFEPVELTLGEGKTEKVTLQRK